jgi:mRNA interferase RelE/StbE
MRYTITVSPEALDDLNRLKANIRAEVKHGIETHLRHEPTKVSKSRIKRLQGFTRPQYRLRVKDVRVFYDVAESSVDVLAIVDKKSAEEWLEEHGEQ